MGSGEKLLITDGYQIPGRVVKNTQLKFGKVSFRSCWLKYLLPPFSISEILIPSFFVASIVRFAFSVDLSLSPVLYNKCE